MLIAISNTSIRYYKEISNLAKIYINNAKYSGHNNNFIFKLAIVYNISSRADILLKIKIKMFSTIFKGLAPDYYYLNIGTSTLAMNFDKTNNSIRNYFKEVEYE